MTTKHEALERLIGSYFSTERDQEAAALMLEEFGRHQHARIEELERGIQSAISVCNSVSTSIHRRVNRDGCVMYLQTEEWCKWAEDEVQAELRALLTKKD